MKILTIKNKIGWIILLLFLIGFFSLLIQIGGSWLVFKAAFLTLITVLFAVALVIVIYLITGQSSETNNIKLDNKVNYRAQFRVEFTRDNPDMLATDNIAAYADWLETQLYEVLKESTIEDFERFSTWLSGHDKETIEQMYKDWKKHN